LDLDAEIFEAGCETKEGAMTGQITDMPGAVVPYAPKAKNRDSDTDQLDRAGNAILGLVDHAADISEADLQEARRAAEKLADQLRAAQKLINKLEASNRYYQDRTNRAEKWLQQISSRLEQRFFGADDSRSARRRGPAQN
jgi:hypothetical protein